MTLTLKILNTALILFAVYMGFRQGWAMLTGKSEMADIFSKWNIGRTGLSILGFSTMLGAVLVLIPQTFVWGNYIMAAGILVIIAFHLHDKNLKGVAIELPFFLLSLLIIYLQHPLANQR
ncbi:hypothetical protein [Spirosoma flavum]|uniref:DoxX family protein n=1 Tax=Spirosoma flavum TaxID=2048557 RepID=A0ABW6ANT0_9BACT